VEEIVVEFARHPAAEPVAVRGGRADSRERDAGYPLPLAGPGDQAAGAVLEDRVEMILGSLTSEEKVSLLSGVGPWELRPPGRLGLPSLLMSDGPNGARGESFNSGLSACFPCETALAATWDRELVREVGIALGVETRRVGAGMLLAPAVNLHRSPLGGRNFECFSEDPELSAQMAAAYVAGVQSVGVACCVKHFVCNDSESERRTMSSDVGEPALRELYLVPFEEAVRAGAWAVMASYNRLNGAFATEHPGLLTAVLREEWGFDGVVVSDWFATSSTAAALAAGLDIEMPGPPRHRGPELLRALRQGEVSGADLDRSARRVLRLLARTSAGSAAHAPGPDGEPTRRLIRRAAARGMVLLRNEGVLPLDPAALRLVAVIGPGANRGQAQGAGSCQVNPPHVVDPVTALSARFAPSVNVRFARGCVEASRPLPLTGTAMLIHVGAPGATVEYYLRADPGARPVATEATSGLDLLWLGQVLAGYRNDDVTVRARAQLHPAEDGVHQLTLAGAGRSRLLLDGHVIAEQSAPTEGDLAFDLSGTEVRAAVPMRAGQPRDLVAEFEPPPHPDIARLQVGLVLPSPAGLIEEAVQLENPPGVEIEGRDRPSMDLPAAQNELITRVSEVNPRTVVALNTGSPVTMPWAGQVAAIVQMWFPGQELGDALADVLTGAVNPSGKLPTTFPARVEDAPSWDHQADGGGRVPYGEGLAMGYRGLAAAGSPRPNFPFGHGLSYSTFALGAAELASSENADDPGYAVTVPVTNTSDRPGREVVQLYVRLGGAGRPFWELKAFASVEVAPGMTEMARLEVPARKLRVWSGAGWTAPDEPVDVRIGTSSADLPIALQFAGGPSPADLRRMR
jgi:beta-glucosidase